MRAPSDPGSDQPRYEEYAPPLDLARQVRCFWRISAANAPPTPNRICPDGCADVLLTSDGRVRAVGTMRSAAVVPLAGRVDSLGVRFEPGEALAFFDVPLIELTDTTTTAEALGWHAAWELRERLADAPTTADRIALLGPALRVRREQATRRATSERVRAAVRLLERSNMDVRRVCEAVGASERALERRFREMVGLSPKGFARVTRFRRALEQIQRRPRPRYAAIALEAGYADQAHFIREFRSLAGVTPAGYAHEWDAVGFVQYGSRIHG